MNSVGRLLRLALVVPLGVVLGAAIYLGILVASSPGPRPAEGWTLLASLPTPRGETAAAVAGGRVYVIGGMSGPGSDASDQVSVYDPATGSWEAAPPLPEARHHAAAAGLDDTVYVSGGASRHGGAQPTLWALDAAANRWRELAPMPEPRFAHRMVALDGMLYVVGGQGATGRVLAYEPATDAWTTGAELPMPRDHLAAVAVDGEIWAVGGRVSGALQARVDIYDPQTDTWRDGPALPQATSGAAEGVVEGVIFVSGGEDPGVAGGVIDRHWQLDTARGDAAEWQPLTPPPLAVHGAHGASLEDEFLIVGGALRQGGLSRFSWTGATQVYRPGG